MPIRFCQKKQNAEPRQKHRHPVIDPLVNPGSPPHRHQTRSKADTARTHHRMVALAQSSPSGRSARALQSKTTTVMLSRVECRESAFEIGLEIFDILQSDMEPQGW